MKSKLDLDFVRQQFPALEQDFIFMDNAGGSQALRQVTGRIAEYFHKYNVQLGGSYEVSDGAGRRLKEVHQSLATYVNASRPEEIVVGTSTTMLLRILSLTISQLWKTGDEVIISNSDHEANVSCWTDLEKAGIRVKTWELNRDTLEFDLEDLKNLLTEKTRLVAMCHVSNILGTLNPLGEIASVVHDAGALICVDGVAYAPHRMIDVQEWDVDFYTFSTYKVYGPHHAVMYGKYELLRELPGINHYFIGRNEVPYKLQPGNFNFELTYSLAGIPAYFSLLHEHHRGLKNGEGERDKYTSAFRLIEAHEQELAGILLAYLSHKRAIRIIGHAEHSGNIRVPTISFVHEKLRSSAIVEKVDPFRIGIRWGDFYAKKLIEYAGLIEKDGVVRVSLVHYNTREELEQLIKVFEKVL